MGDLAEAAVQAEPAPMKRAAVPLALFAVLAATPWLATFGAEGFILSLVTRAMVLALAAMSLDLLIGYAGLVSFGHAAFIGIGAYAVGIASAHGSDELAVQLPIAVAVAALFALATGAISLRTRGVHFIMITLAFGQMLYFLATSLAGYGGDDGMTLMLRSRVLGTGLLDDDRGLFYAVLAVLAGLYLVCRGLVASRFGRVVRGARDNAVRMEAIGFTPYRYQLVFYVIAAVIATVAGVFLANTSEYVSPAAMSWQRSGELIFMVVLGGMGSLHGAVVGAVLFLLVEEILAGYTEHWHVIFGPMLILAVLYARGGLTPFLDRLAR
jgi:branched-chain amino acid transport system permease protein